MEVRELVWQEAAARHEERDGVRNGEIDREDPDFQHVARLGALDVDGTGEDVRDLAALGDLAIDVDERLLDFSRGTPAASSWRGAAATSASMSTVSPDLTRSTGGVFASK